MGRVHLRQRVVAGLALAAVVLLAACTGSHQDAGPRDPFPSMGIEEPGNGKRPDARGPMRVPHDALAGGKVTVLAAGAPSTLDPTRAHSFDATAILNLVTRALTQFAFDPDTNSMVLSPDMATDLGRPNADFTRWTFTLKTGLKYEDGSEVTPDDVAYAISRSFATKELPDGPSYQQRYFLDGDTYQGPYRDKTPYRGVEVDGRDITILMSRPFPDMDYYAAYPMFTGIPPSRDTKHGYGKHPLSTGPYMVKHYRPGRSLTLVKNPYWEADSDPGRIQSVDQWDFEFGRDPDTTEQTIEQNTGPARSTLTYDSVSSQGFHWFADHAQHRLVVGTKPCTYLWYLDMRTITDIRVRKAIGYAYPYLRAWKAAGEIAGLTRVPGTAILPPGTVGRTDYDVLGNRGQRADPDMSRRLLQEANAMGFEITLYGALGDPTSEAVTNVVTAGLEAGGFTVTTVEPDSKIRPHRTEYDSPVNVRSSGWCSDFPTGASWFPEQWDGSLVGLDTMPNPANFKEADADQLQHDILDGTHGDPDLTWGEFDQFLEKTYYPAVNLGYAGVANIRGADIGGMAIDNVRGMPNFTTMYVSNQTP
jgi:peptide/nickel transport system substrate-binding protein